MKTNELRAKYQQAIVCCEYTNPEMMLPLLDEIDRLTRESTAADIRIGNDATTIAELQREQDENAQRYMEQIKTLTAERDAARTILDETSLTLAKRSVERDALRVDAERYRKIAALDLYVGPEYNTYNDVVIDDYDNFNISKESLDAAIDAAMEGQP